MDFSYLLDLAKKNEEYAKEEAQVKRYSTTVSASKKESRSGVQSDAIRKFLARKEEEERKKNAEEKRKKEKLLTLRAQDRKSNARVQAMLKRTKASNKAVLDEAKNLQDTAVTVNGPLQPDEDDYGYVSQEASQFYKKLMEKYTSQPNNNNGSISRKKTQKELGQIKNRTKEALDKTEEGEQQIHKKQSTKKRSGDVLLSNEMRAPPSSEKGLQKKNKSKNSAPHSSLSFDEILKLAATKQHEPIKIEKKEVEVKEKKSTEPERLMTKKEREEYLRERDRHLRDNKTSLTPSSSCPKAKDKTNGKTLVNGKESTKSESLLETKSSVKPVGKQNVPIKKSQQSFQQAEGSSSKSILHLETKQEVTTKTKVEEKPRPSMAKVSNIKKSVPDMKSNMPKTEAKSNPRVEKTLPVERKSLPVPPRRPIPSHRDVRLPPRPMKRPIESDEEEDIDSEMDDFIDDGPDEGNDYSKYIQEIFGYDKSRYRRIESDDDECMETSYVQQMKEEHISTKIGILEDLEDIRREEEERKRKLMKKKLKK